MVGRTDDWIKDVANRDGIIVNPDYLEWCGVAVFKNAYKIYKEKGYKTKLLAAAYRNHYHWSEFIGGDVLETIPYKWQKRFNASDVTVENRMDNEVDPKIIEELRAKFPDFRKAYDADGMTVEEFDTYGAVLKTLKGFYAGYDELVTIIRNFIV
jgi:transaldolase